MYVTGLFPLHLWLNIAVEAFFNSEAALVFMRSVGQAGRLLA